MSEAEPPPPLALGRERERVITLLSRHFASDALTLDELETRLELVYRAASVAELHALPGGLPQSDAPSSSQIETRPTAIKPRSRLLSIMASTGRLGGGTPPPVL